MADDREHETDEQPTPPEKAAADLAAETAVDPPAPRHRPRTREWLRDFPQ